LNITCSWSLHVNNDNMEVPVSYGKVQLNVTQFILAAVIKIKLEFFKLLNLNKFDLYLILPCSYNITCVVVSTSHYKLCLWDSSVETEWGMVRGFFFAKFLGLS